MKRYIRCSLNTAYIPESARKYYKVEVDPDPNEIIDLVDIFDSKGLELITTLEAKSRYAELFDFADIRYVSLCRNQNGEYRIYALTDVDITDKIPYIISRAKRDWDNRGYWINRGYWV